MVGEPCRVCGNTTDEPDRIHGDCRVKIRRELELKERCIEREIKRRERGEWQMTAILSKALGAEDWVTYYTEQAAVLRAVLEGRADMPYAHKRSKRRAKVPNEGELPKRVGHYKAVVVEGERAGRRWWRR